MERIDIARFLVAFASDETVLPFMPGTKKISEETTTVPEHSDNPLTLYTLVYAGYQLYRKYINDITMKYNLSQRELQIFHIIHFAGSVQSIRQITDMAEIPQPLALLAVQKLTSRGFIRYGVEDDGTTISYHPAESAVPLARDLDQISDDIMAIAGKDFSKQETQTLNSFLSRMIHNMEGIMK